MLSFFFYRNNINRIVMPVNFFKLSGAVNTVNLITCLALFFFSIIAVAEDLEPPELTSFSMSTHMVDVSSSSKAIEVFIGLKDASGVERPAVSASGTDNEGSAGFASVSLHSGTISDGVWRAIITIGPEAPSGEWRVNIFPVSDLAFNSWDRFGPSEEYDASFTVISNVTDGIPPKIEEFSLLSTSVNVHENSSNLSVRMRVTDIGTGVENPNLSARSIEGDASTGFANVSLISGDRNDGIWEAVITIPENSQIGLWEVVVFPLSDLAGNTTGFGPGSEFDAIFEVVSHNEDKSPPELLEFVVDKRLVNVTQGSDIITVTMHLRDLDSGLDTPVVSAGSLINSATSGFASVSLIDGDIYDGKWQALIILPHKITGGAWRINVFPLSDLSQNSWDTFGPGDAYDDRFVVINGASNQDLNADGKSDLLWRSFDKGWNFLWRMNGIQVSQAEPINVVQEYTWTMDGLGDYDGDGKSDIFWRNSVTGMNFVYLMDGANIKERYVLNFVTAGEWQLVGNGDFNGDGVGDVMWRNATRGDTWFYFMENGRIGTSKPSQWVTDLNYKVAATGDIDDDGDDDIIWRRSNTGLIYVWLMEDGEIDAQYSLNVVHTDWEIAGAGDLDGDGTDDIVMRNHSDGRNWAYLMKEGQISTSTLINEVADLNWQIGNIGDYDGDGKMDILWRNETTSRNIVHLMDGTSVKSRGVLRPTDDTWQVAK
jgi:hypothetical protein